MNERPCSIAHLEAQIRSAFCGAVLGDGVSIRQSEVMARYGEGGAAVGSFMRCLPVLVQLDREDEMKVQRSFARYWHHHVSSIGQ